MKFAVKLFSTWVNMRNMSLMFSALLLTQQTHAQIIMRFQPNITTNVHYLGDLLLITNDKNNLAKIPLDSIPVAGQMITQKQLITWIKSKKGPFSYQWRGKKQAVIRERVKTSGTTLIKKAQEELRKQLEAQDYSRIELLTKTKLRGSTVPLSAFKVKIANQYPSAKRVCARLNYEKHSLPVWFTVKAYKNVLVAQHKIKIHTSVNENDFVLKERNIAGLKNSPYSQLPTSMWLQKTMSEGQILTSQFLATIPAIARGEKVQIKVINRGVSLTTEAIAQNDGYIGQSVKMKNIQTNKHFFALVKGLNEAEISS